MDRKINRWRKINNAVDRILLTILLCAILITGSALLDNLAFLDRGINGVEYRDFDELLAINPDTVAWLTVEGTRIDHPVVQGKDNFTYLNKAFGGEFYAGGTLFLDGENDRGFRDRYCIIHGHHMSAGAMFGDLERFLDEQFFVENRTGVLLTPTYDYDLRIIAAGIFNAYDGEVYAAGGEIPAAKIRSQAKNIRESDLQEKDRILALSTCAGDMSDDRILVFCRMENRHRHK